MALADPAYIKELFSGFGPVTVRRMFGGAGIFADGLMIGLISGDEIYLKADARNSPAFETEGMNPFTYEAKRRRTVMSYWRLPDRLLDDPEELAQWAQRSLDAARRAAAKRDKVTAKATRPKQSPKLKRRKTPSR